MTRLPIPSRVSQSVLNAANDARSAYGALSGTATQEGLASARSAIDRAMASLRAAKQALPAMQREAKRLARESERDRAIVNRDFEFVGRL